MIQIYSCGTAPRHSERRTLFFDLPSLLFAIILIVALFRSDKLIFYRTFAAQRFVRHLCISKAGTFLSIHFSIFFSRNDVSGQCLRGAEGESSPQSPPAGAFLHKKKIVNYSLHSLFRSDFEEVRKCSGASSLRALVRGIRCGHRYSFWLQHCVDHHFHINFVGPTGTVSRTARSFCKASIKSRRKISSKRSGSTFFS